MRFPITLIVLAGLVSFADAEMASDYEVMKVNHEWIDPTGNTHGEIADFVAKAKYQRELESSGKAVGIRFIVHWRSPSSEIPNFVVRVEARGLDAGTGKVTTETLEKAYPQTPSFSGWAFLDLKDAAHQRFGKLMAWRVTLLQGGKPVAARKSFMWDDSIASSRNPTATQ